MWHDLWATRRWAFLVIGAAAALLLAAGVTAMVRNQPHRGATPPYAASVSTVPGLAIAAPTTAEVGRTTPPPPSTAAAPTAATSYDHAGWDAVPAVPAGTSAGYPAISQETRTDPDAFVAAFGTELLTRNYATTSRAELLSWAQSEAAALTINEVSLATNDRHKALIVSLTSTAWDGAASTIVPSASDWSDLASLHASTTVTNVKIEAVPDFPPSTASFTDPLTLARLYTATTTLHTVVGDQIVTSTSSVAFEVVLGTSLLHGRAFGAACTQAFVQRGQS